MYTEYEEGDYGYSYNQRKVIKKVPKVRKVKKPLTSKQKRTYLIIGIIAIIILIIGAKSIIDYYDSYSYYEKIMINEAKEYVVSHNMNFRNKAYIDLSMLNMEPKEECSLLSGVIVDSIGNYNAYLSCSEYETEVINNDNSVVSLIGHTVMVIPKGIQYVEPGVSYGKYTITGSVGTEEGVYDLTYNVVVNGVNHNLRRIVIVTSNSMARTMYPTIQLVGNKIEYTLRGYDYKDKGVISTDSVDGDLVAKNRISYSHNINPNVSGEYEFVYTVTNSRGYTNTIKRKVVVVENYTNTVLTSSITPESMTNSGVTINVNIFGNNFKSIYLPNGMESTSNNVTYLATSNGDYSFLAIDKDGKSITKIVKINNIDKDPPQGSCLAQVYSNYIDIQANQLSNKQISGFNYIVDNSQSGYVSSTTYRVAKSNGASNIKVGIKDSIGNTSTSTCTIKLMDPSIGNSKVKYYTYNGVEYVIANTKNDLLNFERNTCHTISQSANPSECGDACFSFSLYHAAYIQYGNISQMNEDAACHYGYGHLASPNTKSNGTKADALRMVYNAILNGETPVLQVTGTRARNSRHFVLVVGYRRSKYNASELVEEDLLVIDSWTGCFSTISYSDTSKRTMYDNKDGLGYRVDFMIGR